MVANSYLSLWTKLKLNPYCWVQLTIITRVFYLRGCWHFQDFLEAAFILSRLPLRAFCCVVGLFVI